MARRKRTDSLEAQKEMARMALVEIKPPSYVKLRKCDLPHWASIVAARAKMDWVDADLEVAGEFIRGADMVKGKDLTQG